MDFVFILITILIFGFLIFIHELGHFLIAKKVGVRVEIFSIGFGPKIWCKVYGETEYRVSLIPLGGYVKMAGQEDLPKPIKKTNKPWEFCAKSPGERALIIIAGPLMNFISGFIFLSISYMIGTYIILPEIGRVIKGSPAEKAGILPGSQVLSINGKKVTNFIEIYQNVALNGAGIPMKFVLQKDSKIYTAIVKPERKKHQKIASIGIKPAREPVITKVDTSISHPFKVGDRICKINSLNIRYWYEVEDILQKNINKECKIVIKRKNKKVEVKFVPTKAFRIFTGLYPLVPPIITQILKPSPASKAGLMPQDKIISIAGYPIDSWLQISRVLEKVKNKKVSIIVERNGKKIKYYIRPEYNSTYKRYMLGISHQPSKLLLKKLFSSQKQKCVIGGVDIDSEAYKIGIRKGDIIQKVENKGVSSWEEFLSILYQKAQTEKDSFYVNVEIFNPKKQKLLHLRLKIIKKYYNEVYPVFIGSLPKRKKLSLPFYLALIKSFSQGTSAVIDTGKSFYALIIGKISPKVMGGPVAIAEITYNQLHEGVGSLFWWLGIISINLAIINLFPIPILDGGHLVLLGMEKIKGKPLNEKLITAFQYAGFIFLVGIMIFVIINDLLKIVFK